VKTIEELSPKEAEAELRCLLHGIRENSIPIYSQKIRRALKNLDGKNLGQMFHIAQKIAKTGNLKNNACRKFSFRRPSDGKIVTFDGIKFLERFRALLKFIRKKRDSDPSWR